MKQVSYYIIHNTHKTNGRRGTAIPISVICNNILYNMEEKDSFGGLLAYEYIY